MMNLPNFTQASRASSIALLLTALSACDKAPDAAQEAQQPTAKASSISSSEPTGYEAVSKHLDPGGWLYGYLSTEAALQEGRQQVRELFSILAQINASDPAQLAQHKKTAGFVKLLFNESGIGAVEGIGISSIAIEPGFYQFKTFLHRAKGNDTGFLWKLNGGQSDALRITSELPENTALALSTNLSLGTIFEVIQHVCATDPALQQGLVDELAKFQAGVGFPLEQLLRAMGPYYSIILTLDESRPFTIPSPDPLTIPQPNLLISIDITNPELLAHLEKTTGNAGLEKSDKGDIKICRIPPPVPGFPFKPVIAWSDKQLHIALDESLLREVRAIKAGEKTGLAATEDFKTLMRGLPQEVSSFSYATPALTKLIVTCQKFALKNNPATQEPIIKQLSEKMMGNAITTRPAVQVSTQLADGWLSISRSDRGPRQTIATTTFPIVAIALPAIQSAQIRQKQTSQLIETRQLHDNLLLLEASVNQWSIEFSQPQESQPTTDNIAPYLRGDNPLAVSMRKHPGQISFIAVEGLPPITLPKVGERVKLAPEWGERFDATLLAPFLTQ